MKFKAKISKANTLLKTVQNIMKIYNECICHITPDKLRFIIQSDFNDGMQVFCEIQRSLIFENFTIESLSDNEIQFQLDLENLRRVLQSATSQATPSDIFTNLTKVRGGPVLHFTIKSSTSGTVIFQDIPIVLLTAQQMAQINEPTLPDPLVHILLPNLKNLQKVIDKMKNISDCLKIMIAMNNRLSFEVETSSGSISTFYSGLDHPQFGDHVLSPDLQATVCVDIKKFAKVLHIHQLKPSEVVLCLYERSIIVHVVLTDIMITYYLPVLIKN
ncbi:hypothetical protein ACTFIV_004332 [Dictyostelium citrinum]